MNINYSNKTPKLIKQIQMKNKYNQVHNKIMNKTKQIKIWITIYKMHMNGYDWLVLAKSNLI